MWRVWRFGGKAGAGSRCRLHAVHACSGCMAAALAAAGTARVLRGCGWQVHDASMRRLMRRLRPGRGRGRGRTCRRDDAMPEAVGAGAVGAGGEGAQRAASAQAILTRFLNCRLAGQHSTDGLSTDEVASFVTVSVHSTGTAEAGGTGSQCDHLPDRRQAVPSELRSESVPAQVMQLSSAYSAMLAPWSEARLRCGGHRAASGHGSSWFTRSVLDSGIQDRSPQLCEMRQLPGHASNLICELPRRGEHQGSWSPGLGGIPFFHFLPFELLGDGQEVREGLA